MTEIIPKKVFNIKTKICPTALPAFQRHNCEAAETLDSFEDRELKNSCFEKGNIESFEFYSSLSKSFSPAFYPISRRRTSASRHPFSTGTVKSFAYFSRWSLFSLVHSPTIALLVKTSSLSLYTECSCHREN